MKKIVTLGIAAFVAQTVFAKPVGEFAIANRGGSVSFMEYVKDGRELSFRGDLLSTEVSEPMYITPLGNSKGQRLLAFADRTKNQLSILNANTKETLSQIELSKGAFHQFSHPLMGLTVAVATDIDKGMDLINVSDDGKTLSKKHFSLPQNLTSGNPHDVVLDRSFAYLTVKGVQGSNGKFDTLLQISLNTLQVVNTKIFSEDIHLFNPVKAGFFVVVEEETGDLHLIEQGSLNTLDKIQVAEGIHGISGSEDGKYLFTLDINEPAGSPAVYALENTQSGLKIVASEALSFPIAHNIAVDDRGAEFSLVVTHSGGSQTNNSILKFSTITNSLKLEQSIPTGNNPFGLTFF